MSAKVVLFGAVALLYAVGIIHMEMHFTNREIETGMPFIYEMTSTPWGGFASILLVIYFVTRKLRSLIKGH